MTTFWRPRLSKLRMATFLRGDDGADRGVVREQRPDVALESAHRRPPAEAKQMGSAPAVGGAESGQRCLSARQLEQHARPLVFPAPRIVRVPDASQSGMQAQVIDVPVRPRRQLPVMRQARTDTAGTEGAANVHIPAGPQRQATQPPNAQAAGITRSQNEGVGSRVRGQATSSGTAGYSESNTSLATRTALAAVGQPA